MSKRRGAGTGFHFYFGGVIIKGKQPKKDEGVQRAKLDDNVVKYEGWSPR